MIDHFRLHMEDHDDTQSNAADASGRSDVTDPNRLSTIDEESEAGASENASLM